MSSKFTRILVKLSGEALLGNSDYGIDPAVLKRIAGELQDIIQMGVQVAVVIGGGNIFRGAGLARAALGARVNGKLVDTSYVIQDDAKLAIITDRDAEGR